MLCGKSNEIQANSGVLEGCKEKCTYPRLLSVGGMDCSGTDCAFGVKDVARIVSSSGVWEVSMASYCYCYCYCCI